MSGITTTGNLGPSILQSLAPAFLYTPTPSMHYRIVCDSASMPAYGGTTLRFLKARALKPPTTQLGNSGIDPAPQIPQRDFIDVQPALFGTSCVINEQVWAKKIACYKPTVNTLESLNAA